MQITTYSRDKQQVLLYSTGRDVRYPAINRNGKECENVCVHVRITESLCCTAEINTTLYINDTSTKNF